MVTRTTPNYGTLLFSPQDQSLVWVCALINAARTGDTASIIRLFQQIKSGTLKIDINTVERAIERAFQEANSKGHSGCSIILNALNPLKEAPFEAVRDGYVDLNDEKSPLLPDAENSNPRGGNPLFEAVTRQDEKMLKQILNQEVIATKILGEAVVRAIKEIKGPELRNRIVAELLETGPISEIDQRTALEEIPQNGDLSDHNQKLKTLLLNTRTFLAISC